MRRRVIRKSYHEQQKSIIRLISILFHEFLYLIFDVSCTRRALQAKENVLAVIENQFPVDFHVPFECQRETLLEINVQCHYALFVGVA